MAGRETIKECREQGTTLLEFLEYEDDKNINYYDALSNTYQDKILSLMSMLPSLVELYNELKQNADYLVWARDEVKAMIKAKTKIEHRNWMSDEQ